MPSPVGNQLHAHLLAVKDALRPPPIKAPSLPWKTRIADFILRRERDEPLPPPTLVDVTPMGVARNHTKWEFLSGVIKTLGYAILISPFGSEARRLEVLVSQAEQPVTLHKDAPCEFCAFYRLQQGPKDAPAELAERQREFNEWIRQALGVLTQNYNTQSTYTNASRFAWITGAASALGFYYATPMLATALLVASVVTIAFLTYCVVQCWNERTTLPINEVLDRFFAEPPHHPAKPQDGSAPAPAQPAAKPVAFLPPPAEFASTASVDPRTSEHAPIAPPAGPAAAEREPDECKVDPVSGQRVSPAEYHERSAFSSDLLKAGDQKRSEVFGDQLKDVR